MIKEICVTGEDIFAFTDSLVEGDIAKALAEYAKKEDRMGRIQLIHKAADLAGKQRFQRLDLTDLSVRDKVLHANNDDELTNIFVTDGFFD